MIRIGKIRSLHGIKGEVLFEHSLGEDPILEQLDVFMIELLPGSYIPFFIEALDPINEEEAIVKLEEFSDRNAAASIVHKAVYAAPGTEIKAKKEHDLEQLLQATLYDQHGRLAGNITDYFMNGKQVLLQVMDGDKEHLIPFSDDLLVDYKPTSHQITLHIADGLLDL